MVDPKYDRDRIDQHTREVLRALAARNIDFVTSARIRKEFDKDVAHQTLRPTIERLRDQGDLERWQDDQPSGQATYRITLDYECHLCEREHDSMAAAMYCCSEEFGAEPVAGTRSIRGPTPGMIEAHEQGESER